MEKVTPAEMAEWSRHLQIHPLNEDRRLHYLIAQLIIVLMRVNGNDKENKITVYDIAPWIRSPKEAERAAQVETDLFIGDLYARAFRNIGIGKDT